MSRVSEASLRSRFDLTPAEAQIALGIAGGKTLAAIAEARSVSVSTAREQLKSVFVNSPGDLLFSLRWGFFWAQAITRKVSASGT
jgi:hypothetical protein